MMEYPKWKIPGPLGHVLPPKPPLGVLSHSAKPNPDLYASPKQSISLDSHLAGLGDPPSLTHIVMAVRLRPSQSKTLKVKKQDTGMK